MTDKKEEKDTGKGSSNKPITKESDKPNGGSQYIGGIPGLGDK
jgi:hypothetical protein